MGRYLDAPIPKVSESVHHFNLTATAGQTVFTLPATAGKVILFIGGVIQRETVDYTVNGTTLTTTSPLNNNDTVIGVVIV